jgi:Tol biopolymer transport system component
VLAQDHSLFDPDYLFHLEVSPDGRHLAVSGRQPGVGGGVIHIVFTDGGGTRELLRFPKNENAQVAAWTPDGRTLLFFRTLSNDGGRGLWSISVSGGEPRKLAISGTNIRRPEMLRVHPDGKQLAFHVTGRKSEICLMVPPPARRAERRGIRERSSSQQSGHHARPKPLTRAGTSQTYSDTRIKRPNCDLLRRLTDGKSL